MFGLNGVQLTSLASPHASPSGVVTMSTPLNDIIRSTTASYLADLDRSNPPAPSTIESELLEKVNLAIGTENTTRTGRERLPMLKTLTTYQIAMILRELHHTKRIGLTGPTGSRDLDVVGVYQTKGPRTGLYDIENDNIRAMARQFNNSLTKADFEEVLTALADICPRVVLRYDPDYVAVNNGLFNRPKQALEPFTPERVLIHKTSIDEIVNPSVVQIPCPTSGSGSSTPGSWTCSAWTRTTPTRWRRPSAWRTS